MSYLEWCPSWTTGIEAIDRQHQELVAEIERLFLALQDGRQEKAAERILLYLSEYVEFHFKTEERCMFEAGYPELPAHRLAHDDLRNEVQAVVDAHLAGSRTMTVQVTEYLKNWLINHLDTMDRRMAEYLRLKLPSALGAAE